MSKNVCFIQFVISNSANFWIKMFQREDSESRFSESPPRHALFFCISNVRYVEFHETPEKNKITFRNELNSGE